MSAAPVQQSDFPAHVDQTIGFLGDMTDKLKSYRGNQNAWNFHLNKQQLETLRVRCTPLDLTCPSPAAGPGDGTGFQFVRPIPEKVMDGWLQEKKPWKAVDCMPLGDIDTFYRPWLNAEHLSTRLNSWLSRDDGPELSFHPGIMESKTLWTENVRRFPFMDPNSKYVRQGPYYNAEWILDHRSQEGVKPHIVASLCDNNPMREDGLMISELATISHLTAYRFLTKVVEFCIVPITIISISARDVRVIHAYVDGQNNFINVRKSPIINFDHGEEARFDDWKRLMCWIVAEPDMEVVRKLEQIHSPPADRK